MSKVNLKTVVCVIGSLLAGFGAGAVISFMLFFCYAAIKHGGLW